jgi:flagellar hook-associated protein 1 FlgK
MSSTFSCYSIAKSGIYVSQRALEVLGHNISNADTVGYVRQQTMLSENCPQIYGGKQIGTGVSVSEVRQLRSLFLDNAYRKENSTKNYWTTIQSTVEDIEAVLDSLSESSGLSIAIDEFFQGWEELAKDPENNSAREAVREYGNSFAEVVNQIEEQLDAIQSSLDKQIYALVKEINSISDQVAELNQKILVSEISGQNANDYRDEMNSLLDTLSGYVKIDVSEAETGMLNVKLGGMNIVNGNKSLHMECIYNDSNGTFAKVVWKNSGLKVNITDGKLSGLIDARGDVDGSKGSAENGSPVESGTGEEDVDNDSEAYSFSSGSDNLIPQFRKGLNMLVNLLARKINALHESGIGLDGSTGVSFFVKIDESLPFEAGNIKVNPDLDDPDKIAASKTGAAGDSDIANEIVDFRDSKYFKNETLKMNIDDFYTILIDWIGTTGQEAEAFAENQSSLVLMADNSRQSLSAVSMDEELSNMIKYQHAYNANARVMTTIDSMMDKIINGMGVAGR